MVTSWPRMHARMSSQAHPRYELCSRSRACKRRSRPRKHICRKKKCQCVTFGIEAAVTQGQGRGEFEPGRQAGLSPAWPARHSCTPEVMDTLPSDSLRYSSLGYGCSSLHLRLLHILTMIVTWGKSGNKVKLACKRRATGIGCFA